MWLDRALQQRASLLGFLAQNPTFDGLHNDPRFAAIVDRVGIWKRPLTSIGGTQSRNRLPSVKPLTERSGRT